MYINENSFCIVKAIVDRILNFCKEEKISINELALRSGISQSTLQSIISFKTKNIHVTTLYKICNGMHLTLSEFYQDKVFDDLNDKY